MLLNCTLGIIVTGTALQPYHLIKSPVRKALTFLSEGNKNHDLCGNKISMSLTGKSAVINDYNFFSPLAAVI